MFIFTINSSSVRGKTGGCVEGVPFSKFLKIPGFSSAAKTFKGDKMPVKIRSDEKNFGEALLFDFYPLRYNREL